MLTNFIRNLADSVLDRAVARLLTDPYTENLGAGLSVAQKLGVRNILETTLRAETGKPPARPLGSPLHFSPWEWLLFSPSHLFRLPTPDALTISSRTVLGPKAEKPLELDIPIAISSMSYGGALAIPMKIALARGATLAGTATGSGEAPLVAEERGAAKRFIGQFNRGGWMNTHEQLRQLDAIEIQVGQGAQGPAPLTKKADKIGDDMAKRFGLAPYEDHVIHSRLAGVDSPSDFIRLVKSLRGRYGVPIGVKFAATHHQERELEVAVEAGVDYVVVDGAEAGTHGGPPILQDDLGLPTLYALHRTVRYLEQVGARDAVSVVAAGGLLSPGHYAKALALGADVVYIGSMALIAAMGKQMTKALPGEPPPALALYGKSAAGELDIDEASQSLARYLQACVEEMKLIAICCSKTGLHELSRADLVCTDAGLAQVLGVDYAGYPPGQFAAVGPSVEQPPRVAEPDAAERPSARQAGVAARPPVAGQPPVDGVGRGLGEELDGPVPPPVH